MKEKAYGYVAAGVRGVAAATRAPSAEVTPGCSRIDMLGFVAMPRISDAGRGKPERSP
jgi:hypothetical protein